MTDQEINIAIAEVCGWKKDKNGNYYHLDKRIGSRIPNYCHDLNAMHESACTLEGQQWSEFSFQLSTIIKNNYPESDDVDLVFFSENATARQRCEAFLRMIGKWKE